MRKPSPVMPIAIAAFAITGLVITNVIAQRNRPKTNAELMAEEQAAAQKAQESQAGASVMTPGGGPESAPGGVDPAALGPEFTVPARAGGASGPEITVGYEWTPDLQGDPQLLSKLARQLQELAPTAKLRFVNIDANPAIQPGIAVNNAVVVPPDADGNFKDASLQLVSAALGQAPSK